MHRSHSSASSSVLTSSLEDRLEDDAAHVARNITLGEKHKKNAESIDRFVASTQKITQQIAALEHALQRLKTDERIGVDRPRPQVVGRPLLHEVSSLASSDAPAGGRTSAVKRPQDTRGVSKVVAFGHRSRPATAARMTASAKHQHHFQPQRRRLSSREAPPFVVVRGAPAVATKMNALTTIFSQVRRQNDQLFTAQRKTAALLSESDHVLRCLQNELSIHGFVNPRSTSRSMSYM